MKRRNARWLKPAGREYTGTILAVLRVSSVSSETISNSGEEICLRSMIFAGDVRARRYRTEQKSSSVDVSPT